MQAWRTWFQVREIVYYFRTSISRFNTISQLQCFKYKQIIFSLKSFLQQTVCPAKDLYHDLQDAIEYMDAMEPPNTESQPKKIADFYSIGSKYYIVNK